MQGFAQASENPPAQEQWKTMEKTMRGANRNSPAGAGMQFPSHLIRIETPAGEQRRAAFALIRD
jgi:hypothetical protein